MTGLSGGGLRLVSESWTAWPMEMHQIRYFLALSEELNFTRAAKRCGVSQPSLTNAIKALETELGAPLFYRGTRVALTQLGRAVRPHLRRVAREIDHAGKTARMIAVERPRNECAACQPPES
jgi:DNA-binding transcriptional LysR family regulator